jgi:hypothetical protein
MSKECLLHSLGSIREDSSVSDIGFKIARNKNVLTTNAKQLAFSSGFPMDKILFAAQGPIAGVNKPHGLGYKPTVLAWQVDTGQAVEELTVTNNYQVTIINARAIILFQQGT